MLCQNIKKALIYIKKKKTKQQRLDVLLKLFQDSRLCFRKIVEIERLLSLTAILS